MIQKTKLKKAFNRAGLQITTEALALLEREINLIVNKWVNNTKKGNVKRLTDDLIWIALGNWNQRKVEVLVNHNTGQREITIKRNENDKSQ
tara:strand:+ start:597 stop:869 length:273 start_codon:yes stop_codon:yes gene_type:complete